MIGLGEAGEGTVEQGQHRGAVVVPHLAGFRGIVERLGRGKRRLVDGLIGVEGILVLLEGILAVAHLQLIDGQGRRLISLVGFVQRFLKLPVLVDFVVGVHIQPVDEFTQVVMHVGLIFHGLKSLFVLLLGLIVFLPGRTKQGVLHIGRRQVGECLLEVVDGRQVRQRILRVLRKQIQVTGGLQGVGRQLFWDVNIVQRSQTGRDG